MPAESAAPADERDQRDGDSRPQLVDHLLQRVCLDCHAGAAPEGNLNLEHLAFNFDDPDTFALWVKVHDRIRDREMPPRDSAQPGLVVRETLLNVLDDRLSTHSLQRQQTQGRALARRLNRDEYQNTLRDLLGIETDFRRRLPPDGTAHGFDKVGAGLSISAEHAEAFLAVSDAAVEELLSGAGDAPAVIERRFPQRFTTDHFSEEFIRRRQYMYGALPDAIVRFGDFQDLVLAERSAFSAATSGQYRFTIRARAWQSKEPVLARIRRADSQGNQLSESTVVGFVEFPPEGAERTITTYLDEREGLRLSPYGITQPHVERSAILLSQSFETYPGPGLAIEWVEVEGPLRSDWPTTAFQRLFAGVDFATASVSDAKLVLERLLPLAFRRPTTNEEVRHYLDIYEHAATEGDYRSGIKVTLQAVICSPKFLFLEAPAGPLDDYALASRLAYFLWSSMPDEHLIQLAASGTLREPDVLRHEVVRLLLDPKSAAFVESFTGQWLDLRRIRATTPDPKLYPEFDALLEWSMVEETRRFFETILRDELSIQNFLDTDFAVLNERMAVHYGIPGVEGVEFRKVALPADSVRGGLLSHASILKVTADGTTSSPVRRGIWVSERILGEAIPNPPANVPAVEPDIRGATTIREQLAK
ncbi:MAG: DUF1592 domain-containing protein, partial [Planctomycetaceae bacterium]|nr:DUF1592 domain-containing protein [Planctomycetaceae bacterium]